MLNCVIKESGDGMTVLEFLFVFTLEWDWGFFHMDYTKRSNPNLRACGFRNCFYSMTINV